MPDSLPLDAELDPPGKRERTKAANREAILKAARRVFSDMGFDAATVRDIIRGTDLASGTFYNYFKSKEEVFQALADDGARRFRPILRAVRDQSHTFEEYLNAALTAYFRFAAAEYMGAPLAKAGPQVRAHTPEMSAIYAEVREGIEHAIATGMAPAVDSAYLASACIGMAQEMADTMLQTTPPDIDGAVRFATEFVLGGLERLSRRGAAG
jgi:AcrR family transcriptional regulator